MNRAFETKQSAFQSQEQAWQEYQSIRNNNSPRIDYLNSAQETAYQNMKNAFDRASSAHDSHDGASAKMYATEGHGYQAEAKNCVEERRRLVEECRIAKARHEPYKQVFENAKIAFSHTKDEYGQAKSAHERANNEFKNAKRDFDIAAKNFQERLGELRAENAKRKENNKTLAIKAGIPYQYRNSVYISEESDGTVNIFFGGFGKPDGPGHGHYAMSSSGEVTYKRDPFDPHGKQNFMDYQRDYYSIAAQEVSKSEEFGFNCRFRDYPAYVESGYSDDGQRKIDIYYGPNGPFGPNHSHAGARIDSPYELIFDEIR